jgi:predicted metal-dependent phosphoesterase TrpH
MRLDLHVHSHVSDGALAPAAVVKAAHAGGLDVIALTDHDTVAGVAAPQAAGQRYGVQVVTGIEISTRHGDAELHILGYGVDPRSPVMLEHQELAATRRRERMQEMVERLQALGVPVTFEQVLAAAGADATSIGRPHLARALLAGGHTRYYGEAFERYLYDGGPAFVYKAFPPAAAAIDAIHAAGGLAVWAHPPADLFDRGVRELAERGLDGVECFRPLCPSEQAHHFARTARQLGLFATGGSDWHAPRRSLLGDFYLRPEDVADFMETSAAIGHPITGIAPGG